KQRYIQPVIVDSKRTLKIYTKFDMTNFTYILERLSSRAKNALIMAQLVSEELKHDHIGTEHLLFGVISEKSSFAAEILTKTKLTSEIVKQELVLVNSGNKIAN